MQLLSESSGCLVLSFIFKIFVFCITDLSPFGSQLNYPPHLFININKMFGRIIMMTITIIIIKIM
jgi:hypothetical protein